MKLQGFTDVYLVGSALENKRTLGVIFNIGSVEVSWYIRKQILVAINSMEAEYMVSS